MTPQHDCDDLCAPGLCPDYPCAELTELPAPFYVYVAGRLSGDPGEYLANVARLSLLSRCLMQAGYCPVNPAGDLLEGLMDSDPLPVSAYQKRSRDLLRLLAPAAAAGRACILVDTTEHRNGRLSTGVNTERAEAQRLGIPEARTIADVHELRRQA